MKTGNDCLEVLRGLRRRVVAQVFAVQVVRAALLVSGGLVALAAMERWGGAHLNWPLLCGIALPVALLVGGVRAWWRHPGLSEVAALVDRRAATRDRWATLLSFRTEGEEETPFRALARQECVAYLRGRDFRGLFPWRAPRELPWVAAPLLALAFLLWDVRDTRARMASDRSEGQEEVAETVRGLHSLAQQAERASQEKDSEELRRIAEQLRRSAEQMEASAANREEAQKSAMRELSTLEQLVKAMQEGPARATPEELKALAGALKEKPETEAAAEAMQRGDLAKAAEELEALAKQLQEKQDGLSEAQVEKTLQEALERLAQQRQISEALQQLSQQMAQQSGKPGATNEALQKLAQMLRQMQAQPGKQGGGGKGQQPTEEMLKSLLAALQNMKHGGQPQGDPSQNPGSGSGQIAMQSFSPSQPGEDAMAGDAQLPSGLPGSEKDFGTTASAMGTEASEAAEKGADLALSGQLGEGESLSLFTPAAADDSHAQRRYRELYEAMAPAAQDAVLQEEIPLGSRFFIKRYFEAIRPPQ